jgi:hypothetical protein
LYGTHIIYIYMCQTKHDVLGGQAPGTPTPCRVVRDMDGGVVHLRRVWSV